MNLVVIEDTYLTVKYKSNNEWLEDADLDKSVPQDEQNEGHASDAQTNLGNIYANAPL
jgi:hypothetical protein